MVGLCLLHVNDSETVRGDTLDTLTGSLVNDHAATLEVLSDHVGTSLRQTIVDSLRTLGRSRTNNLYVCTLLDSVERLHILLGEVGLALSEGDEDRQAHIVMSSRYLYTLLDDLLDHLRLAVAELIDLSVESVDLSLVLCVDGVHIRGAAPSSLAEVVGQADLSIETVVVAVPSAIAIGLVDTVGIAPNPTRG